MTTTNSKNSTCFEISTCSTGYVQNQSIVGCKDSEFHCNVKLCNVDSNDHAPHSCILHFNSCDGIDIAKFISENNCNGYHITRCANNPCEFTLTCDKGVSCADLRVPCLENHSGANENCNITLLPCSGQPPISSTCHEICNTICHENLATLSVCKTDVEYCDKRGETSHDDTLIIKNGVPSLSSATHELENDTESNGKGSVEQGADQIWTIALNNTGNSAANVDIHDAMSNVFGAWTAYDASGAKIASGMGGQDLNINCFEVNPGGTKIFVVAEVLDNAKLGDFSNTVTICQSSKQPDDCTKVSIITDHATDTETVKPGDTACLSVCKTDVEYCDKQNISTHDDHLILTNGVPSLSSATHELENDTEYNGKGSVEQGADQIWTIALNNTGNSAANVDIHDAMSNVFGAWTAYDASGAKIASGMGGQDLNINCFEVNPGGTKIFVVAEVLDNAKLGDFSNTVTICQSSKQPDDCTKVSIITDHATDTETVKPGDTACLSVCKTDVEYCDKQNISTHDDHLILTNGVPSLSSATHELENDTESNGKGSVEQGADQIWTIALNNTGNSAANVDIHDAMSNVFGAWTAYDASGAKIASGMGGQDLNINCFEVNPGGTKIFVVAEVLDNAKLGDFSNTVTICQSSKQPDDCTKVSIITDHATDTETVKPGDTACLSVCKTDVEYCDKQNISTHDDHLILTNGVPSLSSATHELENDTESNGKGSVEQGADQIWTIALNNTGNSAANVDIHDAMSNVFGAWTAYDASGAKIASGMGGQDLNINCFEVNPGGTKIFVVAEVLDNAKLGDFSNTVTICQSSKQPDDCTKVSIITDHATDTETVKPGDTACLSVCKTDVEYCDKQNISTHDDHLILTNGVPSLSSATHELENDTEYNGKGSVEQGADQIWTIALNNTGNSAANVDIHDAMSNVFGAWTAYDASGAKIASGMGGQDLNINCFEVNPGGTKIFVVAEVLDNAKLGDFSNTVTICQSSKQPDDCTKVSIITDHATDTETVKPGDTACLSVCKTDVEYCDKQNISTHDDHLILTNGVPSLSSATHELENDTEYNGKGSVEQGADQIWTIALNNTGNSAANVDIHDAMSNVFGAWTAYDASGAKIASGMGGQDLNINCFEVNPGGTKIFVVAEVLDNAKLGDFSNTVTICQSSKQPDDCTKVSIITDHATDTETVKPGDTACLSVCKTDVEYCDKQNISTHDDHLILTNGVPSLSSATHELENDTEYNGKGSVEQGADQIWTIALNNTGNSAANVDIHDAMSNVFGAWTAYDASGAKIASGMGGQDLNINCFEVNPGGTKIFVVAEVLDNAKLGDFSNTVTICQSSKQPDDCTKVSIITDHATDTETVKPGDTACLSVCKTDVEYCDKQNISTHDDHLILTNGVPSLSSATHELENDTEYNGKGSVEQGADQIWTIALNNTGNSAANVDIHDAMSNVFGAWTAYDASGAKIASGMGGQDLNINCFEVNPGGTKIFVVAEVLDNAKLGDFSNTVTICQSSKQPDDCTKVSIITDHATDTETVKPGDTACLSVCKTDVEYCDKQNISTHDDHLILTNGVPSLSSATHELENDTESNGKGSVEQGADQIWTIALNNTGNSAANVDIHDAMSNVFGAWTAYDASGAKIASGMGGQDLNINCFEVNPGGTKIFVVAEVLDNAKLGDFSNTVTICQSSKQPDDCTKVSIITDHATDTETVKPGDTACLSVCKTDVEYCDKQNISTHDDHLILTNGVPSLSSATHELENDTESNGKGSVEQGADQIWTIALNNTGNSAANVDIHDAMSNVFGAWTAYDASGAKIASGMGGQDLNINCFEVNPGGTKIFVVAEVLDNAKLGDFSNTVTICQSSKQPDDCTKVSIITDHATDTETVKPGDTACLSVCKTDVEYCDKQNISTHDDHLILTNGVPSLSSATHELENDTEYNGKGSVEQGADQIWTIALNNTGNSAANVDIHDAMSNVFGAWTAYDASGAKIASGMGGQDLNINCFEVNPGGTKIFVVAEVLDNAKLGDFSNTVTICQSSKQPDDCTKVSIITDHATDTETVKPGDTACLSVCKTDVEYCDKQNISTHDDHLILTNGVPSLSSATHELENDTEYNGKGSVEQGADQIWTIALNNTGNSAANVDIHDAMSNVFGAWTAYDASGAKIASGMGGQDLNINCFEVNPGGTKIFVVAEVLDNAKLGDFSNTVTICQSSKQPDDCTKVSIITDHATDTETVKPGDTACLSVCKTDVEYCDKRCETSHDDNLILTNGAPSLSSATHELANDTEYNGKGSVEQGADQIWTIALNNTGNSAANVDIHDAMSNVFGAWTAYDASGAKIASGMGGQDLNINCFEVNPGGTKIFVVAEVLDNAKCGDFSNTVTICQSSKQPDDCTKISFANTSATDTETVIKSNQDCNSTKEGCEPPKSPCTPAPACESEGTILATAICAPCTPPQQEPCKPKDDCNTNQVTDDKGHTETSCANIVTDKTCADNKDNTSHQPPQPTCEKPPVVSCPPVVTPPCNNNGNNNNESNKNNCNEKHENKDHKKSHSEEHNNKHCAAKNEHHQPKDCNNHTQHNKEHNNLGDKHCVAEKHDCKHLDLGKLLEGIHGKEGSKECHNLSLNQVLHHDVDGGKGCVNAPKVHEVCASNHQEHCAITRLCEQHHEAHAHSHH